MSVINMQTYALINRCDSPQCDAFVNQRRGMQTVLILWQQNWRVMQFIWTPSIDSVMYTKTITLRKLVLVVPSVDRIWRSAYVLHPQSYTVGRVVTNDLGNGKQGHKEKTRFISLRKESRGRLLWWQSSFPMTWRSK